MIEAGPSPMSWAVSRWSTDRWARGAWTGLLIGATAADRAMLANPLGERLVFAGEGVHPTRAGMVHGAYESGLSAAQALIAAGRVGERILVIGAGMAGLAAACTLRHQDRRVQVLEARPRLGGRIHTVELGDGIRADLGAAWLEQFDDNPLAELAVRLGLTTVATDFTRPLTLSAHGPVTGTREALALLADRAAAMTARGDLPLADVLAAHLEGLSQADRRTLLYAVEAGLRLESGLDFSIASTRGIFTEPGVGQGDRYLPAGMGSLVDALADGLDIVKSTHVEAIVWEDDQVIAAGPWGRRIADRAVVALPLAVLPTIRLVPDLPAPHRRALARIGTGHVEKVLLRYKERWWPIAPSGYLWWGEEHPAWCEWADLTDGVGAPVLAMLAAGDAARLRHGEQSDSEVVADAHAAVLAMSKSTS